MCEEVGSFVMDGNSKYYEGCGQEGPIRCIFLCEFHPTAGPRITCQVPENYISKDIFDTVSHYIIPKVQLQRCTLTVTLLGSKVLGFPVRIDNKKYARNAYYFNLCFVCDAWARTVHLEPLVKKLTEYLLSMELETEWLSKQSLSGDAKDLSGLMRQVMQDINSRRMCTLTVGTTTTHLTVVRVNSDPAPVKDHQVPVFLYSRQSFVADQWDLTTNQILPYIDGFNHVSKIAALTDVEISLVRACVQNLVYYGVVTLVPIFQYCAVYSATPKLRQLTRCAGLQRQCVEFCARTPAASERPVPHVRGHVLRQHGARPVPPHASPGARHQREEARAVRRAGGTHTQGVQVPSDTAQRQRVPPQRAQPVHSAHLQRPRVPRRAVLPGRPLRLAARGATRAGQRSHIHCQMKISECF
nr:GATOR complex protein NPRL2-like isoform X1 [Maniola hyperantus]